MKTERSGTGELGGVTDLNDESSFGNGTRHELAVIGTKAKTSTVLRAAAQVFAERDRRISRRRQGNSFRSSSVIAMTTSPGVNGLEAGHRKFIHDRFRADPGRVHLVR